MASFPSTWGADGYALFEDVVGTPEWELEGPSASQWESLLPELHGLFGETASKPAEGAVGAESSSVTPSIRSDRILWLKRMAEPGVSPELAAAPLLLRSLCASLQKIGDRFYRRLFPSPPGPCEIQLACFRPGGFYVRHLDVNPFRRDALSRHLTLILYLNPGWTPSHQGQLRLFRPEDGEQPSLPDIDPKAGALLLFDATRVEHQVLPTFADRFALTLWVYRGV